MFDKYDHNLCFDIPNDKFPYWTNNRIHLQIIEI